MLFSLQNSDRCIFLNVTTLEGEKFTVKLTSDGFTVCGRGAYDQVDQHKSEQKQKGDEEKEEEVYETPYALLGALSPGFSKAFGDSLAAKLEMLVMQDQNKDQKEGEAREEKVCQPEKAVSDK
jgi:hypothetical protein